MNIYVYTRKTGCGTTIRGDREFTSIGQRIELPEKDYKELVRGGGAFIPLDLFEELNFDEKDLVKFGPGYYGEFTPEFNEKCDLAAERFRHVYASVLAEKVV